MLENIISKSGGSWIQNDSFGHPILVPVYNKKIIINNSNPRLDTIKDWFNGGDDIVVTIDGNNFTAIDFEYITKLNQIVEDNGSIGEFELGNVKIKINKIEDISKSFNIPA